MEPTTATVGGVIALLTLLARWAQQERRWHRSHERARKLEQKRRKKLAKERERADTERFRKQAGLADEGGGSKLGHEARKEWDELQRKKKP